MFLKAKNADTGEAILINIFTITSVEASGKNTVIGLRDNGEVTIDLGFQSVSNRLKELGQSIA